jgi:putative ABC transport system substrate-binding protein
MFGIRRREFITLLGSAAATWPLAARAQQERERVRRVGVLTSSTRHDATSQARLGALQQGLHQLGWEDGRNLRIEYRWAEGDPDALRKYAAELVALAPDAILANGSAAVALLLQATRLVPIVFTDVPDPVGAGFVDSLARPGRNGTGFMLFEYGMSGKWLELLKEIAPGLTRAAVLRDPTMTAGIGQFAAIQAVAPSLRVELHPIDVRDAPDIERGIAAFARGPNDGLIVASSPLAARHRNSLQLLADEVIE